MSNAFLAITSAAVIVLSLVIFAYDIVTRRWDAISWRNFFLIGFLHFYGFGCWWFSRGYVTKGVPIQGYGIPYLAASMALFFVAFLATTWWAGRWNWPTRLIPNVELPITG